MQVLFFIEEYSSKLDIEKKEIDSEKKEILELINNNFDKIITTNYDNIFAWNKLENPKQYIKNWINSIEELNDKVYPIHCSITGINEKSNETSEHKVNNLNKKGKKIEFIDTYKSFIENWIIENFTESFKKIIEDAVNQNYTFIFLGYSFEDQFVANSLATFILEKAKVKTWENENFVVLFNDYEKQKNKCDCCDKCKVNVPVVLSTKYVKCDKKPPLDSKLYGIKYIEFSKIFNSEECINLFEVIKKFLNYIKEYANIYDLLNEIDLVFNHEVINESKNFNFEEYFKSDKINTKFENKQELLFIIDFFGKKYDLLNSKITYKEKYIDGILNNLFDWLYKNKEISLSQDIVQFLGKSKLYIKLLKWRINDKEIRKWLGEFV
ncbi:MULTISPECIES: SIR2 family protein [unclassified Spiroplasma]|uniref:SIR2 family protein n=1 Tax=unclassified Spiroplasma TaxID=2637901 RepID=UPI0030D431C3